MGIDCEALVEQLYVEALVRKGYPRTIGWQHLVVDIIQKIR